MKGMKYFFTVITASIILTACGTPQPEWKSWITEYDNLAKRYCAILEKAAPMDKSLDKALGELESEMKVLDAKLMEKRASLKIEEQKELDEAVAGIKGQLVTAKGNMIMKLFGGLMGGPMGNPTNNPLIDAIKEAGSNK
ncbi:MAG: hypothetical protein A2Y33_04710 [Spirochaetes bacterium GWF1_51_8]|nr:MAG: hypothetical protein A2Y33_04710 [Spirochaetes bacterium GWF1_51_8]